MKVTAQIAKLYKDAYFGGNWTAVNLKDVLADVSWQQATTQVYSLNTIVALVYHINYFVTAVTQVLKGQPLEAKDKFSFDHPVIQSQQEWEHFLHEVWQDTEQLAGLIEQLPDSLLEQSFTDEKYGNYYRNLHGIIEHLHYHMGQIVLIKKILLQSETQ